MKVPSTFTLAVVLAAAAGPAFAQGAAPPVSSTPSAASMRVQVRTIENVLVTAVAGGVQQIARKIVDGGPGITVTSGVPRAHGYAIEGHGWFFDVEVPELSWNTIDLYSELQRLQRSRPQQPQQQVGNSSGAQPVAPLLPQEPDTNQLRDEYRQAIREGLMDAILDFGQVPLKPNEYLTVGVRSADSPIPGLDANDTVTLVMQIAGEDLTLFRQARITREDAKKRIKIKEEQR